MVRTSGHDNKLSNDLQRKINVKRGEVEAGDRGYSKRRP